MCGKLRELSKFFFGGGEFGAYILGSGMEER